MKPSKIERMEMTRIFYWMYVLAMLSLLTKVGLNILFITNWSQFDINDTYAQFSYYLC